MTILTNVKNLKRARIKAGLSIRGLSKSAGLSTATVLKIENGDSKPAPATAKKLCDALGASFDDLFIFYEETEVK